MAAIRSSDNQIIWKHCGGFLVREDFVLTAAHCYGRNMIVTLGAHNIKTNEPTQQVIPVLQAIPHPEYNDDTYVNDIMLLKLNHTAQLNTAVQIIALPQSQDFIRPDKVCSVAGWGVTDNGWVSATLREVDLEVQNKEQCEQTFYYFHDSIQLCVGNPLYPKEAGKGDSGGPLVCDNVAQGIVSLGVYTSSIGVYTRISSFVPWIHRIMNAL
ncbi:granzyme-like protein 2 [Orycteropus afer afer]|uniref:Granzyme-like protein 2 n=1 Tax=Orycteropus afer afer TaxID=1230840 RepID=A0A8B7AHR5_ORYAF|nr:granzyme-like protein 2 [Orycteropus afer afer]